MACTVKKYIIHLQLTVKSAWKQAGQAVLLQLSAPSPVQLRASPDLGLAPLKGKESCSRSPLPVVACYVSVLLLHGLHWPTQS